LKEALIHALSGGVAGTYQQSYPQKLWVTSEALLNQ
jgi:hypothetical protein